LLFLAEQPFTVRAMSELWNGLNETAQSRLGQRDYSLTDLASRMAGSGVEVRELIAADRATLPWIPGVELFSRNIYPQRHRGFFGEFARQGEGALGKVGMWPKQWATARMFANTAKGFHIHPPSIPEGEDASAWFQKLFVAKPENYALRPYDQEQWDAMFFVAGNCEMFLVDERAGMERRKMRFIIEGDNHRGPNNAGVIIPSGVAHALRAEGSEDLIMVYGTSTSFNPSFEGRIAADVEKMPLPPEWVEYFGS
jgi:dTDP-4-dehydrorhamnose 3,5-epimerase-like enzyme